uniref:Uncharacterized protein n=1 Tax=Arundo donax TaxID=35708 RepID=A0A0A9GQH6_ARUDO
MCRLFARQKTVTSTANLWYNFMPISKSQDCRTNVLFSYYSFASQRHRLHVLGTTKQNIEN